MNFEIDLIKARLRAPVVSARGSVATRELLVIRLETGDGFVGVGEAAPLESYDGVSIADVRAALEDCRGILTHADEQDRESVLAACAHVAVLPQAIAGIDMALWDLEGRRTGLPVWELLGTRAADAVPVNATVAAADRAGAAAGAADAAAAGFTALKLKVGLGDDAGRVAAVRAAAGPDMAIRLDANGAWSVTEAIAALRALAPAGIELCEEPSRGLDDNAEVAADTDVRGGASTSPRLFPARSTTRWCDSVCLKISRAGGISGLLRAARRAREVGYRVYLASTFDGPLGIAAALHAAAVVGPDRPCGLATLGIFAEREDPLPPRDGLIAVPGGAGLGEGLTSWYLRPAR